MASVYLNTCGHSCHETVVTRKMSLQVQWSIKDFDALRFG